MTSAHQLGTLVSRLSYLEFGEGGGGLSKCESHGFAGAGEKSVPSSAEHEDFLQMFLLKIEISWSSIARVSNVRLKTDV